MQINQTKTVPVEAKTLRMCLKVSDRFTGDILDQDGSEIGGQEDGYVPDFMPGQHYGDYVMLDIDLDTGKVVNWTPPSADQVEAFISKNED